MEIDEETLSGRWVVDLIIGNDEEEEEEEEVFFSLRI